MDEPWNPEPITEVVERFSVTHVDWWIAGGVAIDLFLGWETRPHRDLDIEMFRSDRDVLFEVFPGWDLHVVSERARTPWNRGDDLAPSVFGIWGRPSSDRPWGVEVILADGDDDVWRFRRSPTIEMPRDDLLRWTADGVPYCAPEVALLYKSVQHRVKDDVDLARCLHRLDGDQKTWLLESLRRVDGVHPWAAVVEQATRINRGSG